MTMATTSNLDDTRQEQRRPVLIRLTGPAEENEQETGNDIRCPVEWAMIELNGELLAPSSPSLSLSGSAATITTMTTNRINDDEHDDEENKINFASIMDRNGYYELGRLDYIQDGGDNKKDRSVVMTIGSHELQGTIEKLKQPFCVLEQQQQQQDSTDLSYRIVGVITQKILFTRYPKTIVR